VVFFKHFHVITSAAVSVSPLQHPLARFFGVRGWKPGRRGIQLRSGSYAARYRFRYRWRGSIFMVCQRSFMVIPHQKVSWLVDVNIEQDQHEADLGAGFQSAHDSQPRS
jgi:hypothetical protein